MGASRIAVPNAARSVVSRPSRYSTLLAKSSMRTRATGPRRPFDFGLSLAKALVELNGGRVDVEPAEADRAYAEALRRSARKFQVRIVADKPWTFEPGAQRTDTGHVSIAAEVGRFTQGLSYDVLVVADTANQFGDDLSYRAVDPRPVAGTHGLVPAAWARPFEQWGATQLQLRFQKAANRWMTPRDYGAWMAVRAIGEAATRSRSTDAAAIGAYLRSPRFELAAFKGARLTFRAWDGQLRQPVLLADTRSLVSVTPQPGYLHKMSELDTLGIDQPETTCRM